MSHSTNEMPQKPKKPSLDKKVLRRLLGMLFRDYKPQLIVVIICVVLVSVATTVAGLFMNFFIETIQYEGIPNGWGAIRQKIFIE